MHCQLRVGSTVPASANHGCATWRSAESRRLGSIQVTGLIRCMSDEAKRTRGSRNNEREDVIDQ